MEWIWIRIRINIRIQVQIQVQVLLDPEHLLLCDFSQDSGVKLNCESGVKYLGWNSALWCGGGCGLGGGGDLASPQYVNNRQLLRSGLRDDVGVVY